MEYCSKYYYHPDRSFVLDLSGTGRMYVVVPDDVMTPEPISVRDSPKWVHNPIPRGQIGYLPDGYILVSPFRVRRVYK